MDSVLKELQDGVKSYTDLIKEITKNKESYLSIGKDVEETLEKLLKNQHIDFDEFKEKCEKKDKILEEIYSKENKLRKDIKVIVQGRKFKDISKASQKLRKLKDKY